MLQKATGLMIFFHIYVKILIAEGFCVSIYHPFSMYT